MSELFAHETVPATPVTLPAAAALSPLDAAEASAFARELVAALRRHPHINNVMTHVALGRWERVEAALAAILVAPADAATLSPLARNILDLLWAEAGVTGRILKPLFLDCCRRRLPAPRAEACVYGVAALFARASRSAALPSAASRRA